MIFCLGMWLTDSTTTLVRKVRREERGDVPGWVMITLMSALLVAALIAIAGPRLQDLFNQAIDRVAGMK
ncbi:hypothetical protein CQ018_16465 [Arthrobacter sp. MYb227]|nr:hypothetical protein CQ018_16465 [Arthrobacter sp. MYb227]